MFPAGGNDMQLLLKYLICLLSGYFIGSILFAEILIKITRGRDIRKMGNTNPGAQNIYLHVSKILGAITGEIELLV